MNQCILQLLKLKTFLYDIPLQVFINDFSENKDLVFDKTLFISKLIDIIKKNTCSLFNSYEKKFWLSKLFDMIDIEKKNFLNVPNFFLKYFQLN